jgi:YHS domain-containing protein
MSRREHVFTTRSATLQHRAAGCARRLGGTLSPLTIEPENTMNPDRSFAQRVDEIVAAAGRGREARRQALFIEMTERDAADAGFMRAAERVHGELIRPRIEAIARHFPDARAEELRTPAGVQVRCVFARSDQYPASVTLTAGLLHDPDRHVASVFQHIEIVPMLAEFEQRTHHDVPLDALERGDADADIAGFLDDALLRFVESYLRLEIDPRYQRAATTHDPVCGMTITAADAGASVDHAHHRYYFCSTTCRDKFVASPNTFLRDAAALRA